MRRQRSASGAVVVLLSESVAVPLGLVVAGILTRSLGPEDYGRYSVAGTLITTVEWLMVALLARPTVKFVAEATHWQSVAAAAFRVYAAVGLAAGAVVWALASRIAAGLGDPQLAPSLRLFALELPIFAAAAACRGVLAGRASFRQHAAAGAGRWVGRFGFIVVFVQLGWSLEGAILGNIAGVAVAWGLAQMFVGPATLSRTDFKVTRLLALALPVFLLMLSVRLFDRLGLFALKALGGTAADAGFYGAAQNLLMVAGILSMSLTPVLISSLTALRQGGDEARAAGVAALAIKLGIWLLPFTAIVAGASSEVVALLFGEAFRPAEPVLAFLILAAPALTLVSIASALVTVLERPWPAVAVTVSLLPLAVCGHAVLVPRFAGVGAAGVTLLTALLAAALCLQVVCRVWPLTFPTATLFKSAAVAASAYALAAAWPTPGVFVIVKSVGLSVGIALVALLLREFTRRDIEWATQARQRRAPGGGAGC